MADHSPLYTEADAKIVTDAVRKILPSDEPFAVVGTGWIVGAVLDALAAAGRLLPPGAERIWGIRFPPPVDIQWPFTEGQAREQATLGHGRAMVRTLGPWVELDVDSPADTKGAETEATTADLERGTEHR